MKLSIILLTTLLCGCLVSPERLEQSARFVLNEDVTCMPNGKNLYCRGITTQRTVYCDATNGRCVLVNGPAPYLEAP